MVAVRLVVVPELNGSASALPLSSQNAAENFADVLGLVFTTKMPNVHTSCAAKCGSPGRTELVPQVPTPVDAELTTRATVNAETAGAARLIKASPRTSGSAAPEAVTVTV